MKQGRTLDQLETELVRQESAKVDLVTSTHNMRMIPSVPKEEGKELPVCLRIDNIENARLPSMIPLQNHAHRQVGTHTGIPAKYYDKMRHDAPQLLANNINHWFWDNPTPRLLRTLDGNARAFLSNNYQRIDNLEIAKMALEALSDVMGGDLKVVSCEVTDRRMYIKVVTPKVSGEVGVGDEVQAGVVISNSEIGQGAISIQPLIFRLICLNGMVVPDFSFRKNHVGGRILEGEETHKFFADDTRAADDKAILLKVRDTIKGAVSDDVFQATISKMRDAKQNLIEPAQVSNAVEILSNKMILTEGESKGILGNLIKDGDLSKFGLLNAVTRQAQDVDDYDRATELEAMGGKILNFNRKDWDEIAIAA